MRLLRCESTIKPAGSPMTTNRPLRENPTFRRIIRSLKSLKDCEIDSAVADSLIDVECAVWFLILATKDEPNAMLRQLDVCADGTDFAVGDVADNCVCARNDAPVM